MSMSASAQGPRQGAARAGDGGRGADANARVRVSTPADIGRALREAASAGLRATTTASASPGTVLLDLSALDETSVAPVARTVRVGAGVPWDRLVARTAPHGLTVLAGEDLARPAVGNALVGAVGPVARTFGIAADHVLSIDLVTPDGAARTVTPDTDPELFCALRGGVEGLGVATGMTLGMLALTTLQAGTWWFAPVPADAAADAVHRWRDWVDDLPESISTRAILTAADDGGLALGLRFAHVGDPAESEALLAELREDLPTPSRDTVMDLRNGSASPHLREPTPAPGAVRGALLDTLPSVAVEAIAAAAAAAPPGTSVELRLRGGAMGRGAPIPGCIPGRAAAFSLRALAGRQADADTLVDALAPWTTGGTALDLGDPHDARAAEALRVAWGEPSWSRLTTLRQKLDPDGVLVAPWEPAVSPP
ncbi:FAD-binding oxidoreductase [Xylanimonas sp. McL0601]|uniref:FAD-binding oxidoreductase n=1 Tax=Xylanimonas sp. McL0601 TaxID=3414739 RepID=UPI003CF57340